MRSKSIVTDIVRVARFVPALALIAAGFALGVNVLVTLAG